MLQIFYTEPKFNNLQEIAAEGFASLDLNNKWIHLTNPTDREIEIVSRRCGVAEDLIKSALDEEERARIEAEDNNVLTLIDIPTIEDDGNDYFNYSTMPLGIILTPICVITVCLQENSIIHSFISNRIKNCTPSKRSRFLFQIIYTTHIKFLQYLRQIDKASQRIQAELHRSTKNKELIQLLDLEKSLVYFSTSLRGNCLVIERLTKFDGVKKYEEDIELLDDVAVENKQAIEMCNIYRDILSGTMDAFASVISNNLNIVMKLLTSLTVILAIPTLIASFFGMNTGVPFEGKAYGFYIVVIMAVIATACVAVLLSKKGNKFK